MTSLILMFIIVLLVVVFIAYFMLTHQLAVPYLKCKLSKKSILMLCGEDGALRLIPTTSSDVAILRGFGAWAFDRSSKYMMEGIPVFFGYVRGPAMTTRIETFIAAAKLKKMGVEPEINLFQTVKNAKTKDEYLAKMAFFDFIKSRMTKKELIEIEKEYKEYYREQYQKLSEEFFSEDVQIALHPQIMNGYTVHAYIGEHLPPTALDYYIDRLTKVELDDLLTESKILPELTPIDLTSLYDFANAQNGHMINAKIQRGISEYIMSSTISSKFTIQNAVIAVIILVGIGAAAYMILNGSVGNLVGSVIPSVPTITPSILPEPTITPSILPDPTDLPL